MRYERLCNIKPGAILAFPVIGENSQLMLRAGVQIDNSHIEKLRELKYPGVYIHDNATNEIIVNENISLEKKIEASNASNTMNYDECIGFSHMIADDITSSRPEIYTSMSMISSYDMYTYMHSVNVATYSGVMGLIMGFSYDQIQKLVLAAMLHDIGKIIIPETIINKDGKLTDYEYDMVRDHAWNGYNMLQGVAEIPSTVRVAILEHHENYDGTGYPNGIKGRDIFIFARIIHICDVYDAMITRRSYKEAMNPCAVIEHIMSQSGIMFDPEIVLSFIKNVIPYPEGVMVLLSDGTEAIVKENNKEFVMRPKVLVLPDMHEVNLMKELSLTIIKILV